MIISLRGTSGSGKSTLVRAVVARYEKHRSVYEGDRKRPMYEIHGRNPDGKVVITPGHYLIGNGGMDTLKSLDDAYKIARWADSCGHDVLMEGKNMSDGAGRAEKMHAEGRDFRVVHLDVPVEECIASVRARGHSISEESIRKTDAKVRRDMEKFTCRIFSGDRAACLTKVVEWLGLDPS